MLLLYQHLHRSDVRDTGVGAGRAGQRDGADLKGGAEHHRRCPSSRPPRRRRLLGDHDDRKARGLRQRREPWVYGRQAAQRSDRGDHLDS